MANWTVTVTITQDGLGKFTADVTPLTVGPVVDGDTIDWDITEPAGFPEDAEVFLQFFKLNGAGKKIVDKGCLGGSSGKHNGSSNGPKKKVINGKVKAAPKSGTKHHSYLMAYTATMGSGILVDPEIVVDGGVLNPGPKGKKKSNNKAKKTPPARSAKRRVAAKKAKQSTTAKKAKRATKRKAKKR